MTDFKKGQRVHVEFKGVIRHNDYMQTLIVDSANGYTYYVDRQDVSVLSPANWPPQIGDIWEVEGVERAAVAGNRYHPAPLILVGFDGQFAVTPDELKSLGNPTLVRRRGQ